MSDTDRDTSTSETSSWQVIDCTVVDLIHSDGKRTNTRITNVIGASGSWCLGYVARKIKRVGPKMDSWKRRVGAWCVGRLGKENVSKGNKRRVQRTFG